MARRTINLPVQTGSPGEPPKAPPPSRKRKVKGREQMTDFSWAYELGRKMNGPLHRTPHHSGEPWADE